MRQYVPLTDDLCLPWSRRSRVSWRRSSYYLNCPYKYCVPQTVSREFIPRTLPGAFGIDADFQPLAECLGSDCVPSSDMLFVRSHPLLREVYYVTRSTLVAISSVHMK